LAQTLACIYDLMHVPVCAYAILRYYNIRSWSDTRDQPDNACLMADRVTHIGADEAEGVDCTACKVWMRKIYTGADNANPNTVACETQAPERGRLNTFQ
jgi:hypothetical protein